VLRRLSKMHEQEPKSVLLDSCPLLCCKGRTAGYAGIDRPCRAQVLAVHEQLDNLGGNSSSSGSQMQQQQQNRLAAGCSNNHAVTS
jgi:hypothetical protein